MTLKSLSTKLYLGIAAAAVAAWALGVPGRTVLSFAAVALMFAMHANGHGAHHMPGGSRTRAGSQSSARTGHPSSADPAASARGGGGDTPSSGEPARGGGCH